MMTAAVNYATTGTSGRPHRRGALDFAASRSVDQRADTRLALGHYLGSHAITAAATFAFLAAAPIHAGYAVASVAARHAEQTRTAIETRNSVLGSEIQEYARLDNDWDGYGGIAPPAAAVEDALAFVGLTPPTRTRMGAMVEGSGAVGFYWKDLGIFGDITFEGDGLIRYFVENEDAGKSAEGVARFDRLSMPPDILEIISSF